MQNSSWWKTRQLLEFEQTVGSICKNVANWKLSCIAEMNINWCNHFGGESGNGAKV